MKLVAFAILIGSAAAASAIGSPTTLPPVDGRWIFEIGKSTPDGGTPARHSEVILRDDGVALHWDMTTVDAQGKTTKVSGADTFGRYTTSAGGKVNRMVSRIDANTIKRSVRHADGGSLEDTCKITWEEMVCTGVRVRDGEPKPSTLIFTRAR